MHAQCGYLNFASVAGIMTGAHPRVSTIFPSCIAAETEAEIVKHKRHTPATINVLVDFLLLHVIRCDS